MIESPHYVGHRDRLRDRFGKNGSKALQDYELVELILTYCIPRKDVKPVAKKLLEEFDNIRGILDASPQELEKLAGVGPRSSLIFLRRFAVTAGMVVD